MAQWYVKQCVIEASKRRKAVSQMNICIFGFSFKPDCQDIRNTKVANMYSEFAQYGATPEIYDPLIDAKLVQSIFGISLLQNLDGILFDMIVFAVPHKIFRSFSTEQWNNLLLESGFVVDINSALIPSPNIIQF